ncbi:dynein light chain roadblock-type 2-like [Agrilus planipennis]|uniref:Dynein light chain roadblock n=1 Tax=Agrilus planipennis TaxID=224129 RepID=A0A7F5RG26_AGRPL|nr:dynein light chain roadblock-type 2-like [Agrilus planipennis]
MSLAEVEDILKRIQNYEGVVGYIIVNSEGIPVRTTIDNTTSVHYAGLVCALSLRARNTVRELDKSDELKLIRLRSKTHEVMIAPDKELILIVVQNPVD